ncbi:MAG: TROVE domain-containing protein [Propionicimonas sp.]|uniref:TROVE domain-containing protein n=1 Tax=Propionicimonas sp. TaxID=1955623 RepID=UPI003D0B42B2
MNDLYATVSTRRTPQSAPADRRQERNNGGGYAFTVTEIERVKRFLILGSDAGSYYQGAGELTAQNAQAVIDLAATDGRALVDLIVDVSVGGKAPRQDPALFALAIAAAAPDVDVRTYALQVLPDVARTGTHLLTFARYIEQFRGWGRGLTRAVGAWYTDQPVDQVAHQTVKYRQRNGWSHRDLLRLAHPATVEPARRALFDWIAGREAVGVPRIVEGHLRAQAAGADVPALVREYRLTWDMLPDEALTRAATWDALLDVGIPQTALLRQLPRLTRLGVVGPLGTGRTAEVAAQLTDPARLRKARVHPVNLLVALRTYAAGRGRGSAWEPVSAIIDALDAAFYQAFEFVEPAGRRTLVGLDVSGSMGSPVDRTSGITAREVGAAMSLVIKATEPEAEVYGFTGGNTLRGRLRGLWGATTFTDLGLSPRQRLDDVTRLVSHLPFGPTDCALPMTEALARGLEVDTFVVITDNETWYGAVHPHQALRTYREQTGIPARLVVLATTPTRFTIADPTDAGMLDIAGFSSDVPQLVAGFSRGF